MRGIAWWTLGVAGVALVIGCGGGHGGGSGDNGATRTACAQNLLRLRTSFLVYANDWDDVLPQSDWNLALTPYLSDIQTGKTAVLRCPAVKEGAGVGYAYNAVLVGASLNAVAAPDATALFFDTANLAANVVATYPVASSRRHGGDCVVYLSGRVVPTVDPDDPLPATVRQQCADKLGRIGVALALYTSDNDDRLPTANWMDAAAPYVSGTASADAFRCPAVATGGYGYAFNSGLLGINVTTVDSPSTTPLVFDSTILTRNALSLPGTTSPDRHAGDVTLYLDGHRTPLNP